MPSAQQYQRIVENKQNCPKCGKHLDDKNFTTCSKCRNGRANSEYEKALRRSAMAIFGIGVKKEVEVEQPGGNFYDEILRNIELSGTAETRIKPIIVTSKDNGLNSVLDLGSGSARLQRNVIKKFKLILSQPRGLPTGIFNSFEIRCCLCRKVISYPAWYHSIEYAVNHFHYFVCFDSSSSDKPSCKCYRRE
jgi:hypothetical protein